MGIEPIDDDVLGIYNDEQRVTKKRKGTSNINLGIIGIDVKIKSNILRKQSER